MLSSRQARALALCTACTFCLPLLACGSTKKEQPTPAQKPQAPPIVRQQDTPNLLEQPAAKLSKPSTQSLQATADAIAHDERYTYISFPEQVFGGTLDNYAIEGIDKAQAPQLVMYRRAERYQPLLRVRGKQAPQGQVTLKAWTATSEVFTTYKIEATIPAKLTARDELRRDFYDALAASFSYYGSPFETYANKRISFLAGYGQSQQSEPTVQAWRNANDLDALMSLYTGATSIREALQQDRALLLRAEQDPHDIALSAIKPVPMPSHPWEDMIKALGKTPVVEPLSAAVPADFLYVHFHDLRELVKLAKDADTLGSPILHYAESSGMNADMMHRYERQLILERTVLSETMGHVAAKGVALATSDPFLREGSDVSILFHIGNEAMLTTALDSFVAKAKVAEPSMAQSSYAIDGVGVQLYKTPDRRLERHQLKLGDVLIITNSRAAAERFVKVHKKSAAALADSGDFRYMRALYPYGADQESGFAFIGDAFVANAISPKTKIAQARRMNAQADLQAVANAALLYGWLELKRPASAQELLDERYLLPQELLHNNKDTIVYNPDRGPRSDSWGQISALTPLIEVNVDKASALERDAYERFSRTYQSYWRGYIDPIAARIKRSADGKALELDARILPIIDGTEYRELMRLVGQNFASPGQGVGGLEWTFAVGKDAGLRRELDRATAMASRNRDLNFGWLGDFVSIGARDRNAWVDAAIAMWFYENHSSGELRDQLHQKGLSEYDLIANLPIYAVVDVSSPLGLATALNALRSQAEQTAPGLFSWGEGQPYREVKTVVISEPLNARSSPLKKPLEIHYAVANNLWVIALQREVLQEQLDAILDGRAPQRLEQARANDAAGKLPTTDADIAQTSISFSPWEKDSALKRALIILLSIVDGERKGRILHAYTLLRHGYGGQLPSDEAALRDFALGHFGALPNTAATAPKYSEEEHRYSFFVENARSADGKLVEPVDAQLDQLITELKRLSMSISFEGQGEHRGLHTRLEWLRH